MAEPERWVICPVCKEANPEGTHFCEHCWGAAIKQDNPLTTEEMEEELERLQKRTKLKRNTRLGIAGALLIGIVGFVIYSVLFFTDTVIKPPEEVNSNPVAGEWTMFRRDLTHSGSTGDSLPEGKLKWVFPTGGIVHSSPSVVDGTVYFGSRDYNFYAVDADTGSEKWEFRTGSWVDSSPAVSGGQVFFGSNDGNCYSLDAESGEMVWVFETAFPVRSSPAIAEDLVYFGSDDYFLYALNTGDGTLQWRYDTGSPAYSSPAISNGILFIGSGNGYSYALNSVNGQRRLRYKTHYAVYASPAVDNGTVYFSTNNGLIWAVDGKARTMWREHEIRHWWVQVWAAGVPLVPEPPEQSGFLWSYYLGKPQTSSSVIKDGIMYLGSDDCLVAVDLDTQETLWEFETGGAVRSSPAISGPVVYVGSEDGNLYAVDSATGEEIWKYQTGEKITSSPAVVDGVVYVGSYDGNLYAIE
jgi:outer membrane protein assembly factor BamB/predicted nucleic acid-binding Zn ribbon protein